MNRVGEEPNGFATGKESLDNCADILWDSQKPLENATGSDRGEPKQKRPLLAGRNRANSSIFISSVFPEADDIWQLAEGIRFSGRKRAPRNRSHPPG